MSPGGGRIEGIKKKWKFEEQKKYRCKSMNLWRKFIDGSKDRWMERERKIERERESEREREREREK